jgi:hypothetical protein
MELLKVALGLILLVSGRKLFWLCVAAVGFLVGMELSAVLLPDQPRWLTLLIGLGAGLLGAVLAVVAQRVAFSLAGFYAGAYLALATAHALGAGGNSPVVLVVGGLVGAVLAALILDWALVVLTCLAGAWAVVEALGLGQPAGALVLAALALAGVFVQTRLLARSPRPR